jgi:hypothetical protein
MLQTLNLKWVWRTVFWVAAAILLFNFGKQMYHGFVLKSQAASGRPYTVVRTENGYDGAGALRYTIQYLEAQRSDGSTMWKAITPIVQQRRIQIANGDKILMNESLRRKSTYPNFFAATSMDSRDPETSCLMRGQKNNPGWAVDGTDTIGGYRAVRIVSQAGKRKLITWYAPDVGCAMVQLRLEHETGLTVQNLTSLVIGEPDPALFQVPSSFGEGPPSKLHEPICSPGGSCKSAPEQTLQRLDSNYYVARTNVR